MTKFKLGDKVTDDDQIGEIIATNVSEDPKKYTVAWPSDNCVEWEGALSAFDPSIHKTCPHCGGIIDG